MYGDPTGEVPLIAAAPFIAGAVAVGKFLLDMRVAFLVMEAFSGFPLVDCLENLYKKCFNISVEDCWQTGINAGSAFGFGAVTGIIGKGLKWVTKSPVIIGETMSRVREALLKYPGAKILNNMPDYKAMGLNPSQVTSAMMQFNRKWILEQMRSGRKIIDIGRDPSRSSPSIFYEMEKNMIRNYKKLHP